MKHTIIFSFLALILALSLVSCRDGTESGDTEAPDSVTSGELPEATVTDAADVTDAPSVTTPVLPGIFSEISAAAADGTLISKLADGAFPSPDSALDYEWSCMLAELSQLSEPKLGYTVAGGNALIIMLSDGTPLALYSAEDEPVLLDAFWSRHTCSLLDIGELFAFSSESADNYYFSVMTVSDGKAVAELRFGVRDGEYFKEENSVTSAITESDFNALRAAYPEVGDYSGFTAAGFTPFD